MMIDHNKSGAFQRRIRVTSLTALSLCGLVACGSDSAATTARSLSPGMKS